VDLLPLPTSIVFVHKEEVVKFDFIKKMHEWVKSQIQQQTERYDIYNNGGRIEVFF